jgi:hypothetical protein
LRHGDASVGRYPGEIAPAITLGRSAEHLAKEKFRIWLRFGLIRAGMEMTEFEVALMINL